jgi:hypothetical protein
VGDGLAGSAGGLAAQVQAAVGGTVNLDFVQLMMDGWLHLIPRL